MKKVPLSLSRFLFVACWYPIFTRGGITPESRTSFCLFILPPCLVNAPLLTPGVCQPLAFVYELSEEEQKEVKADKNSHMGAFWNVPDIGTLDVDLVCRVTWLSCLEFKWIRRPGSGDDAHKSLYFSQCKRLPEGNKSNHSVLILMYF